MRLKKVAGLLLVVVLVVVEMEMVDVGLTK